VQLQARSPAFLEKWRRVLRLRQRTLEHFARARVAVPEEKLNELQAHVRWITELLG
jgi:tRNA (adenine22-N1)-methyltransferase